MNGFDFVNGAYRIEKDSAEVLPYAMQWYEFLRGSDKYWTPRHYVRPGEVWTPSKKFLNGHRYVASNGGMTGVNEPVVWPTGQIEVEGEPPVTTVVDGNVTWTDAGAEDKINPTPGSSTWTAVGLTLTNESVDSSGYVSQVMISGDVGGHQYSVSNAIDSVNGKHGERSFTLISKP